MKELLGRLDAFPQLQDDWDGYGAPAPDPRTIANAKRALRRIHKYAPAAIDWLTPDDLTPTTYGTVAVIWEVEMYKGPSIELDLGRRRWSFVAYAGEDGLGLCLPSPRPYRLPFFWQSFCNVLNNYVNTHTKP